MDISALETTRKSLHGVAELILAGPQYRRSGTIRLRVAAGGFATVKEPALAVDGDVLVAGDRRITIASGTTYADLASAAGVDAGAPEGLYGDGSGAEPGDPIRLDAAATQVIARAFADGDTALRLLEPGADPVLWPEHFDLGISLGEVNYGVSPGDGHLAEPYAYVGPWTPREGAFWNASFGAARPLSELPDAAALHGFFAEGRRLA